MDYVVAQVNFGRLVAPLDSPQIADFAAGLEPVNALADGAPGFIWRLQGGDGDATAIPGFEADAAGAPGGIVINMSVWETVEDLAAFAYGEPLHLAVLRRRREWFERMDRVYAAVWWIPRGHVPAVAEAEERVNYLRAHGPTPHAFSLKVRFAAPDAAEAGPLPSPEDWACPV
jgi:hypothetical protein